MDQDPVDLDLGAKLPDLKMMNDDDGDDGDDVDDVDDGNDGNDRTIVIINK